jgi:hypothetical protein
MIHHNDCIVITHEFVLLVVLLRSCVLPVFLMQTTGWQVEAGHQGRAVVLEGAFTDVKSAVPICQPAHECSLQTVRLVRLLYTLWPGREGSCRKEENTRNQMKAQKELRRLRLTHGGPRPEDTDSDIDPYIERQTAHMIFGHFSHQSPFRSDGPSFRNVNKQACVQTDYCYVNSVRT